MKNLLFMTFFSFASFSNASTGGHGGGLEYCPNPENGQLMYQMYDLKEIQAHFNISRRRQVTPYDGISTKEVYFNRAIEKVRKKNSDLADAINRSFLFYKSNVQNNSEYRLTEVTDVMLFRIYRGCEYKQVVNWIDPGQAEKLTGKYKSVILRDDIFYEKLDPKNQAALDFHEAVYFIQRGFGLHKGYSNIVRAFTGQAFSEGEIDSDLFGKISHYEKTKIDGKHTLVLSKECKLQRPFDDYKRSYPQINIKNLTRANIRIGKEPGLGVFYFKEVPVIGAGKSKVRYLGSLYPGLEDGSYENYYRFNDFGSSLKGPRTLDLLFSYWYYKRSRRRDYSPLKLEITLSACGERRVITDEDNGEARYHQVSFIILNSPI